MIGLPINLNGFKIPLPRKEWNSEGEKSAAIGQCRAGSDWEGYFKAKKIPVKEVIK